jgi:hypothetical protein
MERSLHEMVERLLARQTGEMEIRAKARQDKAEARAEDIFSYPFEIRAWLPRPTNLKEGSQKVEEQFLI